MHAAQLIGSSHLNSLFMCVHAHCSSHTHLTISPSHPRKFNMPKRYKLKLSFSSFQLCRSMKPSTFLKTALPPPPPPPPPSSSSPCLFSPINPKAFEIAYPSATFPDPPPTTPTNPLSPFSKRHLNSFKITPLPKNPSNLQPLIKTCNSPSSCYVSPPPPKTCSVSSNDSIFTSELDSESLFSSSRSLDAASSTNNDFSNFSIKGGHVKKTSKDANAIRKVKLKRYASNQFGNGAGEVMIIDNDNDNDNNKSSSEPSEFWRLMPPCAVEGKVKESFAVVTRSDDPYEDFKRSMLEMILEKQMFEAKDLEELLQCYLSLNSRHHHAVIVAAFTEIWEVLFL